MKVIFLHGLGQDERSWKEVQEALADVQTESLALFPRGNESYQEIRQATLQHLQTQEQPFILVGLSLGGLLALDLADQALTHLKGLILSGTQYNLADNFLYRLQILVFKLMPKSVFTKQGADKGQMLRILTELRKVNLTDKVKKIKLPSLLVCGSKDKPNLKAAYKLNKLLKNSQLCIIEKGGHTLNSQALEAFAQIIEKFLDEF
ncbi:alpha/beta fold hydrolase [Streptococcus sanguinis]|uniref:2-succinyl-6-hydroxy-2, 4-cyclohexadiene-1-carboxylate synthase n=1 Tax=Streptococcus sanguinis TaxID=1305 RepID=A0A3R9HRH0_STRSA|nr:alpha/beta hydrolase [Streptococcus sanguinis]RSI10442.1 2-succinyl-6-hydroxy-2,4-cyclohexadiene-1-carboxylate synthase [Streptococcus sanguinis]